MAVTDVAADEREEPTRRPLCAYSPRWLSGPAPRYEGLVATWRPEDADGAGAETVGEP